MSVLVCVCVFGTSVRDGDSVCVCISSQRRQRAMESGSWFGFPGYVILFPGHCLNSRVSTAPDSAQRPCSLSGWLPQPVDRLHTSAGPAPQHSTGPVATLSHIWNYSQNFLALIYTMSDVQVSFTDCVCVCVCVCMCVCVCVFLS